MKKIAMIGEGAWGTAIATVLARNGHVVALWCHDEHTKHTIKTFCRNDRYLPDVTLCDAIVPSSDMRAVLSEAELIFEAIPVAHLRSVLKLMKGVVRDDQPIIALSKGVEQGTLLVPTDIIRDVLGKYTPTAVCMGPSFAREVALGQPTAVEIASDDASLITQVIEVLQNDYFRIKQSQDVHGIQLCAAYKNVIALGTGILSGAGYGDNTTALFLVQAMREMETLVIACGAQRETVHGLAGLGDTILTCMGKLSKNTALGRMIGSGALSAQTLVGRNDLPEGVNTVQALHQIARQRTLALPLVSQVYAMLFDGGSPGQLVHHIIHAL
jgi:glycerol-3-phosphate dehydrogenase (NAD(P)+)